MPEDSFVVASTRSMRCYASRVVDTLLRFSRFAPFAATINGVDALGTDCFADGELEVTLRSSIRERDVVLFTGSGRNEAGIDNATSKIELYHAIDVFCRSQARKIIVFEPYVSCSRSDRTTRRNSVGLWVHFKTLVSLGVQHIVTYQLHSDKSKTMLDPTFCVLDDILGFNLLAKHICDKYIGDVGTLRQTVRNEWAFCSVDAGGENTARLFANAFGAGLVIAHKQRDYSRANTIASINILSAEPVEGKKLWIVDDMIDTCASVEQLVRTLASRHPAEINAAVVHAPFSPPAARRLTALCSEGLLKRLLVVDTIQLPEELRGLSNIEVVSSAKLSALIIRNIITGDSMSGLRGFFDPVDYLEGRGLFAGAT